MQKLITRTPLIAAGMLVCGLVGFLTLVFLLGEDLYITSAALIITALMEPILALTFAATQSINNWPI